MDSFVAIAIVTLAALMPCPPFASFPPTLSPSFIAPPPTLYTLPLHSLASPEILITPHLLLSHPCSCLMDLTNYYIQLAHYTVPILHTFCVSSFGVHGLFLCSYITNLDHL